MLKKPNLKKGWKFASLVASICIMIIIAYYSIIPAPIKANINNLDKLEHLCAYLLLSLSVFLLIKNKKISFLYALIYSLCLEIIQISVPNRQFSFVDIFFNFLGSGCILFLPKKIKKFTNQNG